LKVCLIRNNCSGKVLFVSVIGEAPASPDALLHSSYLLKGYRHGRGIDMPASGNARGIGCSSNAPLENTLQRTEN